MTVLDDRLIDISNHDHSTFDPACFYANGVRRIIIAGERTTSRQQIVQAQAAGITVVALYAYLYWGRDPWGATPLDRTRETIQKAKQFDVPYVFLDCEDAGGTVASRHAELRSCVAAVQSAGLNAGIYTGSWWWVPNMNNSTEFSHLPLWHAAYGPDGDLRSPITSVDYGGWNQLAIHQYGTNKPLCGRNVRDWNYLFDQAIAEGHPEGAPQEDEMTAEQIREVVRDEVQQMMKRGEVYDPRLREVLADYRYPTMIDGLTLMEEAIEAMKDAWDVNKTERGK